MKKKFNSKISKVLMCCLLTALFVTFQTNLYADPVTFEIGKSYPDNVVATLDPATGNMVIERIPLYDEDLFLTEISKQKIEFTDNGDGSYILKTTGADPYVYFDPLITTAIGGDETSIKITFEYKSNQDVTDAAVLFFDYYSTHVGDIGGFSLNQASDWTYGEFNLTDVIHALNEDYYAGPHGEDDFPVFGYIGDFLRFDPTDNSTTYEITIRNLKLEIETADVNGIMDDFTYETQPWAEFRDAIKEVTIKPGVSSIGESAFACSGITKADIPLTVTTIAANAFKGCNSLTDIKVYYADPTAIAVADNAFTCITDMTAINLTVPAGTEAIYQATAPWQYMLGNGTPPAGEDCDECGTGTAIAKIPVESFTLSPNPTDGIVNINNTNGEVVKIYTVSGTLLLKTNASVIDLKNYSSGVYLIKMGDKVGKLIKN
jgi:hypothetical protein